MFLCCLNNHNNLQGLNCACAVEIMMELQRAQFQNLIDMHNYICNTSIKS